MCRFIHRISLLVNDAATLFAIVSIGQKQRRLYFLKNESNTVDRGRRSQRRRTRRNSRRDFGDEDLVGVGRRPGPAAGVAPQLRRVAALLRLPLAAVRPLLALLAHVQQPSIVL